MSPCCCFHVSLTNRTSFRSPPLVLLIFWVAAPSQKFDWGYDGYAKSYSWVAVADPAQKTLFSVSETVVNDIFKSDEENVGQALCAPSRSF